MIAEVQKDRDGKYLTPLDYVVAWDGVRFWFGWIQSPDDYRARISVDGCSFKTTVFIDPESVLRLPNDPVARGKIIDNILMGGNPFC